METFTIEKEVKVNVPIETVFSSLTNSEEIVKYFPLKAVESDWTEGKEDNHLVIEYILSEFSEGTCVHVTQSNIKSKELYKIMESQVWDYLLGSFKQYIESRT